MRCALFSPPLATDRRAAIAAWALDLALLTMLVQLGASLFEHFVVDPRWPENVALIQPARGGLDRKHFWIPAHAAATLALPAALIAHWRVERLRGPLALATLLYVGLRVWTALWFIPRALAFEQAAPGDTARLADDARSWVAWSLLRLPLVVAILAALLLALRRTVAQGDTAAAAATTSCAGCR